MRSAEVICLPDMSSTIYCEARLLFFLDTMKEGFAVKVLFASVQMKHVVQSASLVQEVILRFISSAPPSSSNGHPRVAARERNAVLPAYCFYGEML